MKMEATPRIIGIAISDFDWIIQKLGSSTRRSGWRRESQDIWSVAIQARATISPIRRFHDIGLPAKFATSSLTTFERSNNGPKTLLTGAFCLPFPKPLLNLKPTSPGRTRFG